MPDVSFGNFFRFGFRRLWLMNLRVSTGCCWHWPSAFDGALATFIALGSTNFGQIRAQQIRSDFSRRLWHSEKMPLPFIAIV